MKKTIVKWTTASALVAGMTMIPTVTNASATDEEHTSPSEQSLEQYDDAITENTLIMEGSQSGAVVAIQQELNDRGIDTMVDGIYGPETKQNVELFQRGQNADLMVDGIVGINTWNAMTETDEDYGFVLMQGDQNNNVQIVQEKLNEEGIDTMVDGIYGPETKANVMEYQQTNDRLPVDGIVGQNTWNSFDHAQ